jgi:thioredoxin 1
MNLSEFQHKISTSEKPILIDFWAAWCTPCMVTKPVLEKLAVEYSDQIEFVPVNADEAQEILRRFRVMGIPSVITLRNGQEVGRVTGAQNERTYHAMFAALAEGREIEVPITPLNRFLRLGAGAFFIMLGVSAQNWIMVGIGGVIAFIGMYDRCPVWQAVTRVFKRKEQIMEK